MKQTLTEEGLNRGNVIRRDFRSCLTEAEREAAFVENCSWKLSSSVESTYTPETQIHGWERGRGVLKSFQNHVGIGLLQTATHPSR